MEGGQRGRVGEREGGRDGEREREAVLQRGVIPITSSGCALQSCIFLLFSGRVLDDLPVISSIINICLLVKVGLRLCTLYMQALEHTHTHVHTPSCCSPCSPTQSRVYMEIPAHLSLLGTLYQTCVFFFFF